ncbi:protein prenylyltransferase [Ramicandelaber brevisporus]|nr:protein prenylyltransferase [Ramicandelaber brevisporus]
MSTFHGVSRRSVASLSPEEKAAAEAQEAEKLRQYEALQAAFYADVAEATTLLSSSASGGDGGQKQRQQQQGQQLDLAVAEKLMNSSAALLRKNPDFYTAWNWRRRALLAFMDSISAAATGSAAAVAMAVDELLGKELKLTVVLIMINLKSYGSWNHRRWALEHMHSPNWRKELDKIDEMLKYDARNFHAWNYRRYVVSRQRLAVDSSSTLAAAAAASSSVDGQAQHSVSHNNNSGGDDNDDNDDNDEMPMTTVEMIDRAEFDYGFEKIMSGLLNGSAWHYRSNLLQRIFTSIAVRLDPIEAKALRIEMLNTELDTARNAVFTEPQNQIAWLYYMWLIESILTENSAPESAGMGLDELYDREDKIITELVELEPDCVWVHKACVQMAMIAGKYGIADETVKTVTKRASESCAVLIKEDPDRANMYRAWMKMRNL